MPCKPGVAGSILGFSIKPLSVEPSGVPVILINTQIINPPGPVLVSTHGKATKSCFFHENWINLGLTLVNLRSKVLFPASTSLSVELIKLWPCLLRRFKTRSLVVLLNINKHKNHKLTRPVLVIAKEHGHKKSWKLGKLQKTVQKISQNIGSTPAARRK